MIHSPYIRKNASVQRVMSLVLLALVPGIAAYVWQFGAAILVQLALATVTALAAEALVMRLRRRPLRPTLGDLSAVVTAWLVVLSFPSLAPWWLTVFGVLVAILVAKHLYGGLGQNPFNPAMVAFCTMIVAYPSLMSQWPMPGAGFGFAGGRGWEWIALGYLAGGLFLLATRVITWHMPVVFIAALIAIAGVFWVVDPATHASPLFHLASGGSMLAAFFILTDPVSGATTPRGKLLFAIGVALIAWLIRSFGAYPDGIAFGVLLMNMCVPLIDMKTQPTVFGHRGGSR